MSEANDGEPAFPVPVGEREFWDREENGSPNGMSLRDYFAAAALQGCIEWERMRGVDSLLDDEMPPHSQPLTMDDGIDEGDQARNVAKAAYIVADAMLVARKEGA
jgi:hypothetical protein